MASFTSQVVLLPWMSCRVPQRAVMQLDEWVHELAAAEHARDQHRQLLE
jgi:hypothetical protein